MIIVVTHGWYGCEDLTCSGETTASCHTHTESFTDALVAWKWMDSVNFYSNLYAVSVTVTGASDWKYAVGRDRQFYRIPMY